MLAGQLDAARRIIRAAPLPGPFGEPPWSSDFERIRWFLLSGEAGQAAA